jgi:hypothetical protein
VLAIGAIVLIEAGYRHEIRNTGRTLLKTVSLRATCLSRDPIADAPKQPRARLP